MGRLCGHLHHGMTGRVTQTCSHLEAGLMVTLVPSLLLWDRHGPSFESLGFCQPIFLQLMAPAGSEAIQGNDHFLGDPEPLTLQPAAGKRRGVHWLLSKVSPSGTCKKYIYICTLQLS